jgi:hypothetical protein
MCCVGTVIAAINPTLVQAANTNVGVVVKVWHFGGIGFSLDAIGVPMLIIGAVKASKAKRQSAFYSPSVDYYD